MNEYEFMLLTFGWAMGGFTFMVFSLAIDWLYERREDRAGDR